MRENPAFKIAVQSQIVLRDFDAPINVGEKYVQRLTSYLQVTLLFTHPCKVEEDSKLVLPYRQ